MSEDKIVQLASHRAQVNEELVSRMEAWLEMAKSGEFQAIAIAGVRRDHARFTGWPEQPPDYAHDLSAAVMELFWRFGQEMTHAPETAPL